MGVSRPMLGAFPYIKKHLKHHHSIFLIVVEVEPFKTRSFIKAVAYQSVCQISWERKLEISAGPQIWPSEFLSDSSVTESDTNSLEGPGCR